MTVLGREEEEEEEEQEEKVAECIPGQPASFGFLLPGLLLLAALGSGFL